MTRRPAHFVFVSILTLGVALSLSGCDSLDGRVVGPRAASGVLRITNDSFGLLVFPCGTGRVSKVELGVLDLRSQNFEPILTETFEIPVDARTLVVSTNAEETSPGASRQIPDPRLLRRVNEDEKFLTAPWPPMPEQALVIRAFEAGSDADVSGGADIALNRRFDLDPEQINVDGHVGSANDFRCFTSGHPQAWDTAIPSVGS
jgi:hypothetical protein